MADIDLLKLLRRGKDLGVLRSTILWRHATGLSKVGVTNTTYTIMSIDVEIPRKRYRSDMFNAGKMW